MKANTTKINHKLSTNSNKTKTSMIAQYTTKRKMKKSSRTPRFNGFQLNLKRIFNKLINLKKIIN